AAAGPPLELELVGAGDVVDQQRAIAGEELAAAAAQLTALGGRGGAALDQLQPELAERPLSSGVSGEQRPQLAGRGGGPGGARIELRALFGHYAEGEVVQLALETGAGKGDDLLAAKRGAQLPGRQPLLEPLEERREQRLEIGLQGAEQAIE